jgi:hypothetical protein
MSSKAAIIGITDPTEPDTAAEEREGLLHSSRQQEIRNTHSGGQEPTLTIFPIQFGSSVAARSRQSAQSSKESGMSTATRADGPAV